MKQMGKKILAVIVCLTMIVSVLSQGGQVYAAEDNGAVTTDVSSEYEIYPIPQ